MGISWVKGVFQGGRAVAGASTKDLGTRSGSAVMTSFGSWVGRAGHNPKVAKAAMGLTQKDANELAVKIATAPEHIHSAMQVVSDLAHVLPHSSGAVMASLASAMTGAQIIATRMAGQAFLAAAR